MNNTLLDKTRLKILAVFPNLEALYLFGSYKENTARFDSDVDLAFLLPPSLAEDVSADDYIDLKYDLAGLFQRPVDLINLRTVSTVFRKEVVEKGLRFFTGDKYSAEEFEMLTLSYYQKLNQERRGILQEFKKTGRAYQT